jgi:hypothetical protein
MDRRGFLRASAGALSATLGVFAARTGVGQPEVAQAAEMTLVSGADPDAFVYVEWGPDGRVAVLSPDMPDQWPNQMRSGRGMPRSEFPEFDPAHGVVTIYERHGDLLPPEEWTMPMIRAHYLYALGQRTPDAPVDGNHLAFRFMPPYVENHLAGVLLNGYNIFHVDESYDGAHGWVVQLELGENGQPITHDDGDVFILRKRILTGDVQHWMDGATFRPGDFTAPLLP